MPYICIISCIFIVVFLLIFGLGVIYRTFAGKCLSEKRIDGKTVLITGASAGIGEAAAKELASRGGRLILACRNLHKAENVAQKMKLDTGNVNIKVMQLDTSDMKSVEAFASKFIEKEKTLDILINNAGAMIKERKVSPQGLELTYATNHLGHFLLTNLLLDTMKASKNARIINVSSDMHKMFSMDFDDINYETRKYSYWSCYAQSKLCNILFTNELALKVKNTGITCNSLHPGAVSTEIISKSQSYSEMLLSMGFSLIGKTKKQGAETVVYLAVAEEVSGITGEYFSDCKMASSSKESKNREYARRLWEISEKQANYFRNKTD